MASLLSSARSRPSQPRFGSEEPRIFTPPLRPLTPRTSLGFALIEFADEVLLMPLLPWQKWLAIHALELLPDNTFRFRTVVLLVARQSGKSTFLQVLALFFLYVRSANLVIGTAQNLDIAEEVWQGAVDIARDVDDLAAEISRVNMTNGKKALELRTGERYKVQAANRRGGRGLSGDLVLMDELREHQSWDAWGAITKTTMARALAMIWAASNAGDATSVVLRYLRKMAHAALGDPDGINSSDDPSALLMAAEDVEVDADESLGIFEWSATPGCDISDPEGWGQANPSMGYTITERAISSARKTDPEWVFRTEVLCQWSDGSLEGPFPTGTWEAGVDPASEIVGKVSACVDVSADQTRSSIAFAGFTKDGVPHVEVVASRAGTEWVEGWLTERLDVITGIAAQGRGAPVSGLLDDWEDADLPVTRWQGADLSAGTSAFYNLVRANGLKHLPQPLLDVAAATAATKPAGDGVWLWDRRKSATDIAPLVAATGAVWLLQRPVEKPFVSAYADRGVEVI